jgi:signal transduction histidine kinase
MPLSIASRPADDTRAHDYIHDLGNLFAVISSGVHLLQDRARTDEDALLLHAIDSAAACGGDIARVALVRTAGGVPPRLDLNSAIADLQPALAMTLGLATRLTLDLCADPLPVAIDEHEIDSAILELALNASRALKTSGGVTIRTRRVGARAWLLIADDGHGVARALWPRLGRSDHRPHGLPRVERWLRQVHGRLHWRSSAGSGTVVALDLPLRITLGGDRHARHRQRIEGAKHAHHSVAA